VSAAVDEVQVLAPVGHLTHFEDNKLYPSKQETGAGSDVVLVPDATTTQVLPVK